MTPRLSDIVRELRVKLVLRAVTNIMNTDHIATESGASRHTTVNQLILKLAALRDADSDVGAMRVVDHFGNDILAVNVAQGGGEGDDAFVVALR